MSNAATDEDACQLVIDGGLGRNVVECNFRDAKSEVSMADYYQTAGWLA